MAITRRQTKKDTPLRVPSISATNKNYRACKAQTIKNIEASIIELNSTRTLYDDKMNDIKQKQRVEQNKMRLDQIREQKRQYCEENINFKLILKKKK